MLAEAEPGLDPLYQGCKTNRENWEKLQQESDKLSKFNLFKKSIKFFFYLFLSSRNVMVRE
jgi:hypothetical protein